MNDSRLGITKENLMFAFPVALQGDASITAQGAGAAEALALRPAEIDRISIYPRIDELPEDLLDILAYDFKVDWYDYQYPIAAKRALIKGNILAHKRQGTVFATRSVLTSLYPNSTLEEWFTYDGTPGCFRLNVNVSNSGAEGAVEVYSTEEIRRRIATVKRLSAHLESVSYMVRNAIVVGHRIDSWQYRVPECNTLRCGTWWMRSTLGWSEKPVLHIGADPGPVTIAPELTGTLPDTATPGWSVCGALRVGGVPRGYADRLKFAGPELCGTVWMPSTLGWSEHRAIEAGGKAEPFGVSPEFTGTLPEPAAAGYSLNCGAMRAGGRTEGFTIRPELTGTLPEEVQDEE